MLPALYFINHGIKRLKRERFFTILGGISIVTVIILIGFFAGIRLLFSLLLPIPVCVLFAWQLIPLDHSINDSQYAADTVFSGQYRIMEEYNTETEVTTITLLIDVDSEPRKVADLRWTKAQERELGLNRDDILRFFAKSSFQKKL